MKVHCERLQEQQEIKEAERMHLIESNQQLQVDNAKLNARIRMLQDELQSNSSASIVLRLSRTI